MVNKKLLIFVLFVLLFLLPVFSYVYQHNVANNLKVKKQISNSDKSISQQRDTSSKKLNNPKQDQEEIILYLVIFIAIVTIIVGIIYGLTDKAIFYMDSADLFMSFLPSLIIMGVLIYAMAGGDKPIFIIIGLFISILFVLLVFIKSFRLNKKFIPSFSTAVAKLVIAGLALFKVLEVFFPTGDSKLEKEANRLNALIFLFLLTALINRLINGDRVIMKNQNFKNVLRK